MTRQKATYWFKYEGKIVAAVRMQDGTSERVIREHAVTLHRNHPYIGCDPHELPYEREVKIRQAIIQKQ